MTAVNHGWSNTIVVRLMSTTPAATSRADTSLTGLGNVNRAREVIRRSSFSLRALSTSGPSAGGEGSSSGCPAPGGRRTTTARPDFPRLPPGRLHREGGFAPGQQIPPPLVEAQRLVGFVPRVVHNGLPAPEIPT